MTETSFYWADEAVGDGSLSPYDNDEFSDIWRVLFQRDRTTQGYIEGHLNELIVTNPSANNIEMDTGAALVDGKYYTTDDEAVTTASIATPAVATRIDRVVLRKSWAAQTVRFTIITGVEGAGVPAITQTDGVTWDVPIAQVSITTGAVITITDERSAARTPLAESTSSAGLQHIETLTGNGASGTLDFSNIPTTFRHLFIIGQILLDGAVVDADVNIRFNNDSGANYNEQDILGINATPTATAATGQTEANVGTFPGASATANHVGQLQLHIAAYKDTDLFKTFVGQFNSLPDNTVANFDAGAVSGLWEDTTAIDQIELLSSSGNFETGTSVSLYGII